MTFSDTIAAVCTAKGPGAISIVRVSGPDAFSVARKMLSRDLPPPGAFRLERIYSSAGGERKHVDDALVLVFKAPRSYTGEDTVEFQCHGGHVTPARVLAAAFAAGAREARRGEFTEKAFFNGRMSFDQAEAVLDLVNARTARAADDALEGVKGSRGAELKRLYGEAVALSAELEHSLDVDEGELPPRFMEELAERVSRLRAATLAAAKRERARRIFREGATVVLSGPPNAGKSSLMNALLGEERAIVSDTPGTTRDAIEAWLDVGGWPVRMVDTAGLRGTVDQVEREGVRRAREMAGAADVVVAFDESGVPPAGDAEVVRIHAKCDISRGEGLNVSAKTGEGVDTLLRKIGEALERRADSRQAGEGGDGALAAFDMAAAALDDPPDELVPLANRLRDAASHLGIAAGAVYADDLLDNLFSRFCVGK